MGTVGSLSYQQGDKDTLAPAAAFVNCHPVFPEHSDADPVCVVIGGL